MANLEVLALDPTAPQIEAPQTGNGYSMPRLVNIAPEAVTGTATTPSLAIAQAWSTTGAATALQVNVTSDTGPSNAASKLLDLQVGGVSKCYVNKSGGVFSSGYNGIDGNIGMSANTFYIGPAGGGANWIWPTANTSTGGVSLTALQSFSWSSGSSNATPPGDLALYRDAANTLGLRNGVNAQRFNLYNTYTSASVYERVSLYAASNVFYLGSDQTGATLRPLLVNHGATAYAALPAANTCEGARAYVTDSTVSTFGATVAGGGANKTVVWSNGTNWLVG